MSRVDRAIARAMESRKAVEYAKAFREIDVCEIVHEFRKLRPHLTDILSGKVSSKLSCRWALIRSVSLIIH